MNADRVTLALAIVSALIFSHTTAWLYGRDQEAQLALDAYQSAEYAHGVLAQCVEASELSLIYIREYDRFLAAQVERRRRLVPLSYMEDR